ncbi:MAG: Transcriptional regulator, MerR family / Transcriptional regulator, MerR family [uncultured Truepera sp.]|uniref:Transcriptional regulator, MerR family / Transcriptional regulator, MerR family n=1 Tax=uncultured Truepera sp. TaxID=543023 RepID=A0A6J4V695_9DEIN|nr:MAG: Transcriptional regulator, MerR family / Transcriptional regulator, MerR family [uncultured Truepera sp.]
MKKKPNQTEGSPDERPLYVISVAAELVDMHPQTLRLYERKGLIEPSRSSGQTRLYSQRDIDHLREIRRLTQELGVNLAGVEEIIRLRRQLDQLQGNMESRIGVLQGQISERILDYRTQGELTAPEGDADEALEQDDPATP